MKHWLKLIGWGVGVALVVAPLPTLAGHQAEYDWLVGSGLLCDFGPGFCPVVSVSRGGDTIALTGAGTLSTIDRTATGGGTFEHRAADGSLIGSGTWEVTRFVSFHSYGSGEEQGLPPEFAGGRARLRVMLTANGGGPTLKATLEIDCTLGDRIPRSAVEGIELSVRRGPKFRTEVSGGTVFIRTGPAAAHAAGEE